MEVDNNHLWLELKMFEAFFYLPHLCPNNFHEERIKGVLEAFNLFVMKVSNQRIRPTYDIFMMSSMNSYSSKSLKHVWSVNVYMMSK